MSRYCRSEKSYSLPMYHANISLRICEWAFDFVMNPNIYDTS